MAGDGKIRRHDIWAIMNDPDLAKLRSCASRFRQAMERTDFSSRQDNLVRFPEDCCHHASELLKRFLREEGFGEFQTMAGNHPTSETAGHEWLEKDGMIVDITADQFELDKVMVTRNSEWHRSLRGKPQPLGPEDEKRLWEGDGFWKGYETTYRCIVQCMQEHSNSKFV